MSSTCNWPVDYSCLPDLPAEDDEGYEAELAQRNAIVDLAITILWSMSGRQFGLCDVVLRPCPERGASRRYGAAPALWHSYVYNGGGWTDISCGCASVCASGGPSAVHLNRRVYSIESIVIGDETLSPEQYRLENGVLYRLGGIWPSQNLGQPIGEPNTWAVHALVGQPVPEGAAYLTGTLAAEFKLACDDDDRCRIPRNVESVSRRGVTYTMYKPDASMARRTGIAEIDMWLDAINPHKVLSAPTVR